MKALLFAAGKGTRLKPFTDHHPKALAKVNGVPLLERNIRYLQAAGVNDFVINIHHFGEQIVEFLEQNNNFGSNIQISDEKEELLETGGGLVFAQQFLEDSPNFIIMNADILTNLNLKDFIDYHLNHKNFITLAVSNRESSRKLLFNSENKLQGWINKSTGDQKLADEITNLRELAFSGIHCVNREIFNKITRSGKFSIIDEYLDLMKIEQIKGYEHDALIVDVGRPSSIIEAEKHFK